MKILLALFTMFVSAQSFASTTGACCCEGRHVGPNGTLEWYGCEYTEIEKGGKCESGYTYWTSDDFKGKDHKELARICAMNAVPVKGGVGTH